jgi:hypothetical protein
MSVAGKVWANVAITVRGSDAMKAIIQIRCYNEKEHLGQSLAALPRSLVGIDCITRRSRLIRNISRYVERFAISTIRTLVIYRPGKTLFKVGAIPVLIGG